MQKRQKILIVGGSGFLGRSITMFLSSHADVATTHRMHPFFPDSLQYDLFADDVHAVFGGRAYNIVIFVAKVAFAEDEKSLQHAMRNFLSFFGESHVVFISSDGIFDGSCGMYAEYDIPRPVTLYGRNLLACETLVQKFCTSWSIIRPSYIYGRSLGKLDSRLQHLSDELRGGQSCERFHDMYKSPVDVNYLARTIVDLVLWRVTGIFHIAGARMSVYDFCAKSLHALGVPTGRLLSVSMPQTRSRNMLPDTSLSCCKLTDRFGYRAPTIKETFSHLM